MRFNPAQSARKAPQSHAVKGFPGSPGRISLFGLHEGMCSVAGLLKSATINNAQARMILVIRFVAPF
jgi:hypothetical protein